jgi:hypothetical protein
VKFEELANRAYLDELSGDLSSDAAANTHGDL